MEKEMSQLEDCSVKSSEMLPDLFYGLSEDDLLNIDYLIKDIRGKKVIVDSDLARLYGVKTKRLNEQIKRNISRFPSDFMFQLTKNEKDELVANCDQLNGLKHSSAMPNVFTEHGVVMTASVLNTKRAIEVSIYVVRAFVRFRKAISNYDFSSTDLYKLKDQIDLHEQAIRSIIKVVRGMMESKPNPERKIGFITRPHI
ncbi:MAG: ORF6N domain-containing protein [Caldisericia bacterium]